MKKLAGLVFLAAAVFFLIGIVQNKKTEEWTDTVSYQGQTYVCLPYNMDIFAYYFNGGDAYVYQQDIVHPVPHETWDVVCLDGDVFVLEQEAEAAAQYYADDGNYDWYFVLDGEETEQVFPISVSETERDYVYDMDDMEKRETLLFDDIEKMGSLKKTSKDGFVSAVIGLAYYDGAWYWRTERIDVNQEGDPEYIIALPESLNQKLLEETEPEPPLHSELYLPAYTTQQIVDYFEEVVLHVEYSDGTGDVSLVQKWTAPIRYRIYGTPTEEDSAVLNALFAQLNAVSGFPGIAAAEEGEAENFSIHFLDQEALNAQFSEILHGEYANGATQFWYDTDTNELHTAKIGYSTELDQSIRNSILIEEVINTLGITDTVLRTDSIVYQYSDENLELSEVDWIILKLLYHPCIRCGMNMEACAAVIQELYY